MLFSDSNKGQLKITKENLVAARKEQGARQDKKNDFNIDGTIITQKSSGFCNNDNSDHSNSNDHSHSDHHNINVKRNILNEKFEMEVDNNSNSNFYDCNVQENNYIVKLQELLFILFNKKNFSQSQNQLINILWTQIQTNNQRFINNEKFINELLTKLKLLSSTNNEFLRNQLWEELYQPYPIGEHIAIRPTKQTNTIIWHQNDPLDDVPIMSMQELMLPQLTEPIPILLSRTPSPQHDYNNNSFSPTLTDHHHHYCLNMMSPEDETNPVSFVETYYLS
ncbi:9540_t:CDS:2 [Entrophospora sp. SA101]|nr:9540_t:CDS:2 [Entrophospora sp. SA101]